MTCIRPFWIFRAGAGGLGECDFVAKRILTSAIGLIIFFGVLFAGNIVFSAAVFIVTLVMLTEFHKAMAAHRAVFAVSLLSGGVIAYSLLFQTLRPGFIAVIILYLAAAVFLFGKVNFKDIYASGFATLFITIFMTMISLIRREAGVAGALLVFLCAWITDSGAYFAGYFLGRHKLVPHLSPKKTVEGAVGGIIACTCCCLLYLLILQACFGFEFNSNAYIWISILGLVASVFAQLGDLTASAVKRDCNVKDFGYILPGHGGVMDRFDSVVFIAPLIYYILFNTNIF